ncbi:hypothetical protein SLA2020_139140 [Shorea laevis]
MSEEVSIDNIFNLRSDFALCRNEVSDSEEWSEGTNWGIDEEEEELGDWRITEVVTEAPLEQAAAEVVMGPESDTSQETSEGSDKVSETIELSKATANDGETALGMRCNLKNASPKTQFKSAEANDGETTLELRFNLKNASPKTQFKSAESVIEETNLNKVIVEKNNNPIKMGLKGKKRSKTGLEGSETIGDEEWANSKHMEYGLEQGGSPRKNSRSDGEFDLINRTLSEDRIDRRRTGSISEEDSEKTRPFWEGLASDKEILQGRVERLARARSQNRKKKNSKSKGRMKTKVMKNAGKLQQVLPNNSIFEGERKRNCAGEAAELWAIEKPIGLIDNNNAEEIVKRLEEMEKEIGLH